MSLRIPPAANRRRPLAGALVAIALLSSCAQPPRPASVCASAAAAPGPQAGEAASAADLGPEYEALARAGGQVWRFDPSASRVRIHAFRGGRAGRLGHNHVLAAPAFDGYAHVPEGGLAQARFDLAFRLDRLTFDDPADRAALGPAYASQISPAAIASTREHMLGDSNLQADRFPEVLVHGLELQGEPPRMAARVAVTLHGQTREQWVALQVEGLPDRLTVSGSMVLKQTDFGAQPYTVAGGLLSVLDAVVVDFRLVGR